MALPYKLHLLQLKTTPSCSLMLSCTLACDSKIPMENELQVDGICLCARMFMMIGLQAEEFTIRMILLWPII